MNEHQHPGPHPDADQINAFVEGVLPEHERLESLAHFAECSRCRALVFVAQEAAPLAVEERPEAAWKKWFAPMPVFAAALGAVLLAVVFFQMHHVTDTRKDVAVVAPQEPLPLPAPMATPAPEEKAPPRSRPIPLPKVPQAVAAVQAAPVVAGGVLGQETVIVDKNFSPPGATSAGLPASAAGVSHFHGNPAPAMNEQIAVNGTLDGAAAGAGAGTAVAAAPAPQAPPVQLGQLSMKTRDTGSIQNQSLEIASDTVEVSNAVVVSNLPLQDNKAMKPLPSALAVARSVSVGDRVLAEDSEGALFLSEDGGERWSAVERQWEGKVTQLATVPTEQAEKRARRAKTSPAVFELTTDTGAIWLSDDGLHWRVK